MPNTLDRRGVMSFRSFLLWGLAAGVALGAAAWLVVGSTRQECVDRRLVIPYMTALMGDEWFTSATRPTCPVGFYISVNEKSGRWESTCPVHGALRPTDGSSVLLSLPPDALQQ